MEIKLYRDWAPNAVDHFLNLVRDRFFDNQLFYNVQPGYQYQFGIASSVDKQRKWETYIMENDEDVLLHPVDLGVPLQSTPCVQRSLRL
eukprot:SAG31_NODE_13872_length_841_cov_0.929919_1_plen_89_part_00